MTDSRNASYAALALRLATGTLFLAHAGLKYFVFTPAGAAKFFDSVGVPAPFAYLTIGAEVLGGLALILGFHTRIVSLALIPILLGAILMVHGANGFFFTATGGGWEFPAFWIVALGVQALLGNGAYAVRVPQTDANRSITA